MFFRCTNVLNKRALIDCSTAHLTRVIHIKYVIQESALFGSFNNLFGTSFCCRSPQLQLLPSLPVIVNHSIRAQLKVKYSHTRIYKYVSPFKIPFLRLLVVFLRYAFSKLKFTYFFSYNFHVVNF